MPMVHSIELKNSLNHLRITIGVDAHYRTAYFLHHFPPKTAELNTLGASHPVLCLVAGKGLGHLVAGGLGH